jgi:hypothetical protein
MGHTVVEPRGASGTLATVQISRRAVLVAGLLAAVGCGKRTNPPVPVQAADPDAAAVTTARNIEAELLATYHAKIANATATQRPQLQVELAIHAAHLAALHGAPTSVATVTARPHLRRALISSATTLRELSLAAVQGTNAALFASIAASHETSAQ